MSKDKLLTDLITELAKTSSLDDKKMNDYKKRFNDIYAEKYRHEYSEVTRVLFSIEEDEARDFLIEKIKNIRDEMEEGDIKKRVSKLWDHINLENIRMRELGKISSEVNNNYSKLEIEYKKLEKKMNKINDTAETVGKDLDKMNKSMSDSTTNSITILGIFAGIVMAFTGGLTFIGSALQNINAISIYRLVFIVILLSAAIFNIIFMLIYVIGKITGSYIGSKCNCDNQFEGCNKKTNGCSVIRYPIAMWFNVIALICLFGTCIVYIIDRYNILTLLININLLGTIMIIAIVFILTILFIIFGIRKLLSVECKYEENETIFSRLGSLFNSRYKRK